MGRRLAVVFAYGLAALAFAAPSSASHQAGPCNTEDEPGHSEFAEHHIVPFAKGGMLGAGGHKPGAHGGMSLCSPSENRP
jgi:hypothetical protein